MGNKNTTEVGRVGEGGAGGVKLAAGVPRFEALVFKMVYCNM